jgi:hypothetical protein
MAALGRSGSMPASQRGCFSLPCHRRHAAARGDGGGFFTDLPTDDVQ